MIRPLTAGLALVLTLFPSRATAGIDVDPADLRPELYIKAERLTHHRSTPSQHQAADSKPVPQPIRVCKVDPENDTFGCRVETPQDPATPDDPELTEGDILNAVREIGLPSLQVRIQPNDETLVNIDTIFYTEPQPFERSVELLGFDIDLQAAPVSYQWVHGDGTIRSTTRPGRPYPEMDVTHRYREPADGVRARVDVTYRVRFRVDDGPWQTLSQTLIASGPAAELDVKEAAPVLTKP